MTGSLSTAALLTGTAAGVVALGALGLARAGRRAGMPRPRTLAAAVAAGLIAWLEMTAWLAQAGVLGPGPTRPPRWPLLPLSAFGTLLLLSRTATFGRILAETPRWQPVALQAFRAGVELAFWRLHAEGVAPVQVTFEGRNLDALVGITAPLVAAGIARGWLGPRSTIAWNLLGLAMLFNAIGTVATSAPGPFRLAWPGEPFAAIAAWPVVWIPGLLAPVGIFLHLASIRQALGATLAAHPRMEGAKARIPSSPRRRIGPTDRRRRTG